MRRGLARRRGKPRLFLSAPSGLGAFFSDAAPKPRPAPAPLRSLKPLLPSLFLSSYLPLARFRFSALFHVLSLASSFFFFFSFPAAASPPPAFSFSPRAPASFIPAKKRGKERKKGRKKAGRPSLPQNKFFAPGAHDPAPKKRPEPARWRSICPKQRPPRRVGALTQALGGRGLTRFGAGAAACGFCAAAVEIEKPALIMGSWQGCGPCPGFGQIGAIAESQQNSCRGPH